VLLKYTPKYCINKKLSGKNKRKLNIRKLSLNIFDNATPSNVKFKKKKVENLAKYAENTCALSSDSAVATFGVTN
jgi:hypothetical protein